jgi:hypothetical protein
MPPEAQDIPEDFVVFFNSSKEMQRIRLDYANPNSFKIHHSPLTTHSVN